MSKIERIELEYTINTIPKILYYRLSNPSGLEEWFATKVVFENGIYTFKWSNSEQKAILLEKKTDSFVRYKWLDSDDNTFFQFSITMQELTGEVALQIIDFVEPEEKENSIEMWNEQIEGLKHTLGV
jgi:uncharacterized protein YndB with AHSA1/START domain